MAPDNLNTPIAQLQVANPRGIKLAPDNLSEKNNEKTSGCQQYAFRFGNLNETHYTHLLPLQVVRCQPWASRFGNLSQRLAKRKPAAAASLCIAIYTEHAYTIDSIQLAKCFVGDSRPPRWPGAQAEGTVGL